MRIRHRSKLDSNSAQKVFSVIRLFPRYKAPGTKGLEAPAFRRLLQRRSRGWQPTPASKMIFLWLPRERCEFCRGIGILPLITHFLSSFFLFSSFFVACFVKTIATVFAGFRSSPIHSANRPPSTWKRHGRYRKQLLASLCDRIQKHSTSNFRQGRKLAVQAGTWHVFNFCSAPRARRKICSYCVHGCYPSEIRIANPPFLKCFPVEHHNLVLFNQLLQLVVIYSRLTDLTYLPGW